jgi:hypothetical protein
MTRAIPFLVRAKPLRERVLVGRSQVKEATGAGQRPLQRESPDHGPSPRTARRFPVRRFPRHSCRLPLLTVTCHLSPRITTWQMGY